MSNKINAENCTKTVTVYERVSLYAFITTNPKSKFEPSPDFNVNKDAEVVLDMLRKAGNFKVQISEEFLRQDIRSYLKALYAFMHFTELIGRIPENPLELIVQAMKDVGHVEDIEVPVIRQEEAKEEPKEEKDEVQEIRVIKADSKEELISVLESILGELRD